ncbi:MAG: hypothetical protein R2862_00755 [Thermoanaerobaculia bacterium]
MGRMMARASPRADIDELESRRLGGGDASAGDPYGEGPGDPGDDDFSDFFRRKRAAAAARNRPRIDETLYFL